MLFTVESAKYFNNIDRVNGIATTKMKLRMIYCNGEVSSPMDIDTIKINTLVDLVKLIKDVDNSIIIEKPTHTNTDGNIIIYDGMIE